LGEIFAGCKATAALPRLLETIAAWRPDLIVRESAEFAAAVAAARADVPLAVGTGESGRGPGGYQNA
jgi:hypothetical protein